MNDFKEFQVKDFNAFDFVNQSIKDSDLSSTISKLNFNLNSVLKLIHFNTTENANEMSTQLEFLKVAQMEWDKFQINQLNENIQLLEDQISTPFQEISEKLKRLSELNKEKENVEVFIKLQSLEKKYLESSQSIEKAIYLQEIETILKDSIDAEYIQELKEKVKLWNAQLQEESIQAVQIGLAGLVNFYFNNRIIMMFIKDS